MCCAKTLIKYQIIVLNYSVASLNNLFAVEYLVFFFVGTWTCV